MTVETWLPTLEVLKEGQIIAANMPSNGILRRNLCHSMFLNYKNGQSLNRRLNRQEQHKSMYLAKTKS